LPAAAKAKTIMADPPVVLGREEKAALVASGVQKVSNMLVFVAAALCFFLQIAAHPSSFCSFENQRPGRQPPSETGRGFDRCQPRMATNAQGSINLARDLHTAMIT
jgi:hypothetical protein